MAYPRRSSRSPRSRFTIGLLILTAITLVVLDLPGTKPLRPVRNLFAAVFQPVRSAGDALFEPVSNGWKGAFGYGDLKDENDRLRDRLAKAEGQEADVRRLEAENAELRKLNDISVDPLRTRTARVVSAPLSNFDQSVEIDQGSGGGIKKGMAVVTSGNSVFGRIQSTRAGSSRVQIVTEPNFDVGVRLADGTRGVAHGQGRTRRLVVDSIAATKVAKGDYVYTSGVELSAFPPDLKVGRVTKVTTLANGARSLEIDPLADLESVFVKVVLKDPPS